MIRITTYCMKPHFLSVLLQSLAGLPATITIRHDSDDLLKGPPADMLFINDTPDEIVLVNQIRKSDPGTPVIFIKNEFGPYLPDSGNNIFINGNVSVTCLFPKLQALLNSYAVSSRQSEIRFGNSVFNYANRELIFENYKQLMSKKEAEMLRAFYLNRNNIILKDEIVRLVWGRNDMSAQRSFSVYLTNLKKIIRREESIAIRTVRGLGYIFYMDHV